MTHVEAVDAIVNSTIGLGYERMADVPLLEAAKYQLCLQYSFRHQGSWPDDDQLRAFLMQGEGDTNESFWTLELKRRSAVHG